MSSSETSVRRVRVVAVLLLVGVFAAGGLAGVGLDRWLGGPRTAASGPPPESRGPLDLRDLELSPEQQRQADAIGERHRPEFEALRREMLPRAQAIHARMEQELREILTPAQQERLDGLVARQRSGPPPDPFGPRPPAGPPPPAAVDACSGSDPGAACRFPERFGTIVGTCRAVPESRGALACVPAGGPPPAPPPGP